MLSQAELKEIGDRLYEQVAKPLEAEHWGEFIAIAQDGRYVLDPDHYEISEKALKELGRGSFIFKIGPRVSGRIGGPRRVKARDVTAG